MPDTLEKQGFKGLPALAEKEVKEALELLEKHAVDLSNSSVMLEIPSGTKNGELNGLVKRKILEESDDLRERLGEPRIHDKEVAELAKG